MVVAGSLLGNSFVAGRMAVAAANQGWLPSILKVVGHIGPTFAVQETPGTGQSSLLTDGEDEDSIRVQKRHSDSESDAPINAIILSTVLSALHILLGNFRALLTFNGLGEYPFFLLTVIGAVVLRWREPELERPYQPSIVIPIIFSLVASFVVVRGAAFAPAQAAILTGLWGLGLVYYAVRTRYWA